MINDAAYSNFPRLLSIVTFSLRKSNSLNVSTEDIFPRTGMLKFGRHFERVGKKFQFLHAQSWPFTRVLVRAYGAIFFLKIDFFGIIHGDKPTCQNDIS